MIRNQKRDRDRAKIARARKLIIILVIVVTVLWQGSDMGKKWGGSVKVTL